MKLFVTGGAGFIGSNFIHHLLERPGYEVINFDALTYAGNLKSLSDLAGNSRYRFVKGDITSADQVESAIEPDTDAVVNFAAETHVDRSILDSSEFVQTNIRGTQVLLELLRKKKARRLLQISTDEVYGSLGSVGKFEVESPLSPNSPYAASKAAADLLVRAYHQTYGLDVVTTRCSNNYGPFQFPEKFIPLMVLNGFEEKPLPIYGDGKYTRDWIHVRDHCQALEQVLNRGRPGSVYNIGGDAELTNLEVVRLILEILGKSSDLIQFVKDRPGHDRRYAVDSSGTREEFGWAPRIRFQEGLRETVLWYQKNEEWVKQVRSGDYLDYYRRMYEDRETTFSDL